MPNCFIGITPFSVIIIRSRSENRIVILPTNNAILVLIYLFYRNRFVTSFLIGRQDKTCDY